jgi:outer membrane protein assembly factor BamA
MIRLCICVIALTVLALQIEARDFFAQQTKNQETPVFSDACSQSESERTANLEEAEKGGYAIGQVGFLGNHATRDSVLRRRILLEEAEPLTRAKIEESLKRLSKLKMVYPLRFANVEIQLDRANKIAQLTICVTEKRKQR